MAFDAVRAAGRRLAGRARALGELVMFSHTLFSLSFAAVSALLAAGGLPPAGKVFWVLAAFLGARTGANALNRVIDAEIDARNPRTASRQIPSGRMGKGEALAFALLCFAGMVLAAAMLNPLCLALSPAALLLMTVYSYTKRFTWLCHLVLGAASACAPVGAWVAVTGGLAWTPLLLGAANALWVAGFDVVYGAQDAEFDRQNGLHSIPARFGVRNALLVAASFHAVTVALLAVVGGLSPLLGPLYGIGVCTIAVLFHAEYRLVSPDKLGYVKIASYGINQIVSVVLLVFGSLDVFL